MKLAPARAAVGRNALVALACFAAAWLGAALRLPPSDTLIIWPPAGVALAAAMLGGWRLAPGILIGAFAGRLLAAGDGAIAAGPQFGLALVTAVGATAQALVGRAWQRSRGQGSNRLVRPAEIARLYVMGGLLPGLIGATLDLGGRLALDAMSWRAAALAWTLAYIAQVLGVIVVSPLVLLTLSGTDAAKRRRAWQVSGVAAAGLALCCVLTYETHRSEQQKLRLRFNEVSQSALANLQRSIQSQLNAIAALEAYLSVDKTPDGARFAEFASRIRARNDSIAVLEWIPRVPRSGRAAFESWAQQHGDPGFHIREAPGRSDAASRPDHFPVAFADPLAVNRQALGFDLGSNPARLVALQRSRDSGETAITERITLVQDGKPAVLAAVPLFVPGAPTQTLDQRRAALAGYALGVIRISELIAGAMRGAADQNMRYWVEDRSAAENPTLLYSNQPVPPKGQALAATGAGDAAARDRFELQVGGRQWLLSCAPSAQFLLMNAGWNVWMAMFVGLVLTTAVVSVALVVTGQEQSLRLLVDERTRALRVSEDRLQVALSASNTGSWDWQPQTGQSVYSDTWFTMLGFAPQSLRGNGDVFFGLIHPDDAPRVEAVVREVLEGKRPAMDEEFRMRRSDGSWTWIKSAGRVVERDAAGQALRMSGVHVDVSAAHEVSQELALARDAAISASQAKSAFLAAVSHELRTPLTSIRGFAELLESRLTDARHQQQARLIRTASEHLNDLLTEILDLAKVEAGSMTVNAEPQDLRALLRFSAEFFQVSAVSKGLELGVDIRPELPATLVCDGLRLKQILNNLLSNALKFTSSGSVTIRASADDREVHFQVVDTGPGIPPELHELIFERFQQADDRISYQHGGTGLGLALSRALAGLMGGHLTVQSEPGRGSSFTLSLPRLAAPMAPSGNAESAFGTAVV